MYGPPRLCKVPSPVRHTAPVSPSKTSAPARPTTTRAAAPWTTPRSMPPPTRQRGVQDRGRLWNEVEASETRSNSRVAREIGVALPKELAPDEQRQLVRGFVAEQCVRRGMVADVAYHGVGSRNPHAHVLLTTRRIGPDGFAGKDRSWNDRALLQEWRQEWAAAANRALWRADRRERIDHRSLADQQRAAIEQTAAALWECPREFRIETERVGRWMRERAAAGAAAQHQPAPAGEAPDTDPRSGRRVRAMTSLEDRVRENRRVLAELTRESARRPRHSARSPTPAGRCGARAMLPLASSRFAGRRPAASRRPAFSPAFSAGWRAAWPSPSSASGLYETRSPQWLVRPWSPRRSDSPRPTAAGKGRLVR